MQWDDRCELDPNKICDNCFRCLELDTRAYAEIPVSRVLLSPDDLTEPASGQSLNANRRVRLHIHPITIGGVAGRHRRDLIWESAVLNTGDADED